MPRPLAPLLALLVSGLCAPALASDSLLADFHPLGPHPRLEPLQSCTRLPDKNGNDVFSCRMSAGTTRISFTYDGSDRPSLQLSLPGGRQLRPALNPFPAALASAWTADLNRDGQPDYLLNLAWNGNGIEAEASVALFLLSNRTGYRASALDTMLFDPRAVVRMGSGLPTVIHTALVSAPDARGTWHSFWVHHFLRVQGDRLVLSGRAPVWVQFKFRPDPRPTRLLSEAAKRRAWAEYKTEGGWHGYLVPVTLREAESPTSARH